MIQLDPSRKSPLCKLDLDLLSFPDPEKVIFIVHVSGFRPSFYSGNTDLKVSIHLPFTNSIHTSLSVPSPVNLKYSSS